VVVRGITKQVGTARFVRKGLAGRFFAADNWMSCGKGVLVATTISLELNGANRQVTAEGQRSLLSVLRDDLLLSGCKYGCGEGECGACTVLIDGKAVRSCITPLAECAGKRVTTVEGLAEDGKLHPVQQAFLDAGAMQCGYCTTGMIMSGVALLHQHPQPTREQVIEGLNGNICRCGTYPRIIAAMQKAGELVKGGAS
jgi:aerobic-type carbon monoxide dehydrogenase small subunit (CoxS/CutS family)